MECRFGEERVEGGSRVWSKSHILKHFGAYTPTLGKAFVDVVGISRGSFMGLVVAWQDFCTMNLKGTRENTTNLLCSLWKYWLQELEACENTGLRVHRDGGVWLEGQREYGYDLVVQGVGEERLQGGTVGILSKVEQWHGFPSLPFSCYLILNNFFSNPSSLFSPSSSLAYIYLNKFSSFSFPLSFIPSPFLPRSHSSHTTLDNYLLPILFFSSYTTSIDLFLLLLL